MLLSGNQIFLSRENEKVKPSYEFSFMKRAEDIHTVIQEIRSFPLFVINQIVPKISSSQELQSFLSKASEETLLELRSLLMEQTNLSTANSEEGIKREAQFLEEVKNNMVAKILALPPDEVENQYKKVTAGAIDMNSEDAQDQLNELTLDQLKAIYEEIASGYDAVTPDEPMGLDDIDNEEAQGPRDDRAKGFSENTTIGNDDYYEKFSGFVTDIKISSLELKNTFGIDKEKYPNLYKLYSEE